MFIASLITIVANSFLLLVLCIDPLKIFRSPTSYFLIGLAIADLLTALIQEPILATCYVLLYFRHPLVNKFASVLNIIQYFATFSLTASFSTIFAFTITQYMVVSSPLKYGLLVTRKKALIIVVAIYLFSAMLWCLRWLGVLQLVHLIIQAYVSIVINIGIYILLHLATRKKMKTGHSLQGETGAPVSSRHFQLQRNFVRLNFTLLVMFIVCGIPSTVLYTTLLLSKENALSVKFLITSLVTTNLLFLKIGVDPFVYAWRIPKYRESLRRILCRCRTIAQDSRQVKKESKLESKKVESMPMETNGSTITLLSFKNIAETFVPSE